MAVWPLSPLHSNSASWSHIGREGCWGSGESTICVSIALDVNQRKINDWAVSWNLAEDSLRSWAKVRVNVWVPAWVCDTVNDGLADIAVSRYEGCEGARSGEDGGALHICYQKTILRVVWLKKYIPDIRYDEMIGSLGLVRGIRSPIYTYASNTLVLIIYGFERFGGRA